MSDSMNIEGGYYTVNDKGEIIGITIITLDNKITFYDIKDNKILPELEENFKEKLQRKKEE